MFIISYNITNIDHDDDDVKWNGMKKTILQVLFISEYICMLTR